MATRLVAVVVGALLIGLAALWYVQRSDDGPPWESDAIGDMAFSDDRTSVLVRPATWRPGSCTAYRAEVDQSGSEWTVELKRKRTAEFCTLGACITDGTTIAEAMENPAAVAAGCPHIVSLDLDEPAPVGVTLKR